MATPQTPSDWLMKYSAVCRWAGKGCRGDEEGEDEDEEEGEEAEEEAEEEEGWW